MKHILIALVLATSALAQLPDAPSKVVDKKFLLVNFAGDTAMAFDYASTKMVLDARAGRESNPIFGPNPSTGRLTAMGAGFSASFWYGTYWLKKHHSRFWWVPRVVQASLNTRLAVHNFRMDRRHYTCTDYSDGRPRVCQ